MSRFFELSLPSAREWITIPRVERDWLIYAASFKRCPVACVYFCLSDPARSTKCNFEDLSLTIPVLGSLSIIVMIIVNMEWERELSAFMRVDPM